MKPHEIAACILKRFEDPENFVQETFFAEGDKCCTLGGALLCLYPNARLTSKDNFDEMVYSFEMVDFTRSFATHAHTVLHTELCYDVGVITTVNDAFGLDSVRKVLNEMVKSGDKERPK